MQVVKAEPKQAQAEELRPGEPFRMLSTSSPLMIRVISDCPKLHQSAEQILVVDVVEGRLYEVRAQVPVVRVNAEVLDHGDMS